MNWEMIIPIIVALVSSIWSYLGAVKKAKLDMEKELEIERLKHKQELEKLEREMEVQKKSKENDVMLEVMKPFMERALEDPKKMDSLMALSEEVEKLKKTKK